MKNEVFPKGFLVTFCKKSRFRNAKPADSIEKHLSAISFAESANRQMFRKKHNYYSCVYYVSCETSAQWHFLHSQKDAFHWIGRASLSETTTFAKVVQNPLSDTLYRLF